MSGIIYPTWLLGRTYGQKKTPVWSTGVTRALSGKTSRLSFQQYPLYRWELEYEFLSDGHPQMPSRTNSVAWSQDVTQWSSAGIGAGLAPVIVANYSRAPDGTLTADRLILNLGTGTTGSDYSQVVPFLSAISGTSTASVWMKTNDGSTVTVVLYNNGYSFATVTSQWQRFSCVGAGGANAQFSIFVEGGNPSISKYADLSVWGAQLEVGSIATANIPTFGQAVRTVDLRTLGGLFNRMAGQGDTFLYDDPDFDTVQHCQFALGNGSNTVFPLTAAWQPGSDVDQYSTPLGIPLGFASASEWIQNTNGPPQMFTARYGSPELLSSSSRTNLVIQSNFAATWAISSYTLTVASGTAPDGTTTAAKATEGSSATHQWNVQETQASIISASARFVCSVWLKYIGRQYVELVVDDGGSSSNAVWAAFDILNGIAGAPVIGANAFASAADIQMQAYPNGWYRCSVALQNAASVTGVRFGITSSNTLTAPAFYPNIAGINGDAFYLWGAQIETGIQPTALIPTTTAHVTVGADYSLSSLSTSGPVNTFQQVVFASAPANNAPLLWSGSFFYRCKFAEDLIDFDGMMSKLWTAKAVKLESILL